MKKYIFLLMACLASFGVVAQHHHQPAPQPSHYEQHHDPHHHDPHHNDPHHHPAPAPAPAPVRVANAEQLQMALQILDKQSYDDKRMEVARLCVVLCPFPVRDLSRMASRFTMEDRKVDFLKFAYRYCPDPENYYLLREVLRYHSDYDRLMESVDPRYRRPY